MEKTFIPATKEAVIMVRKTLGRRKNDFNYTIILEREDDGGYHAFCPALPGCHSQRTESLRAEKIMAEAASL